MDGGKKLLRQRKIGFFPQKKALHFAANAFQCGGILGKSGGGDQGPAGLCGPCQPEDQVCRAVAAEDLIRRNSLVPGKLCTQLPAKGVRVAVCRGQGRRDGICHALRQAQRADVGRKIQRIPAKLRPVTGPVAAMNVLHCNFSFLMEHPLSQTQRV